MFSVPILSALRVLRRATTRVSGRAGTYRSEEAGAGGKRNPTQRLRMQTQGACDAETLQKKRHRGSGRMRQLDFKEGRVRKGVAEEWKFTKKKARSKNGKTT